MEPKPKRRGWRKFLWMGFIAVLAWVLFTFVWVVATGNPKLEISPETTVITGPVGADGKVDYLAWMEANSKAPPEDNAVITFLQILGPATLSPPYGGVREGGGDCDEMCYRVLPSGRRSAPTFPHPRKFPKRLLSELGVTSIPTGKPIITLSDMESIYASLLDEEWDELPEVGEAEEGTATGKSSSPQPTRVAWFLGHGKLFDDTHPLVQKEAPSYEENYGIVSMQDIHEASVPITKDILEKTPILAHWFQYSRGVTDPLIGLDATRWYYPIRAAENRMVVTLILPNTLDLRRLAQMAALETRLDYAEGETTRGWRRMIGLMRLGRVVQRDANTLLTWLIALSCETIGMDTLAGGMAAGVFSADDLRGLRKELAALPQRGTPKKAVLMGERFMALDIIQRFDEFGLDPYTGGEGELDILWRFVDRNEALRLMNRCYQHLVDNPTQEENLKLEGMECFMGLEDQSLSWWASNASKILFGTPGAKRRFATKLFTGRLLGLVLPAVSRSWKLGEERNRKESLLSAQFEVELYRKQNGGELPAKLEEVLGDRAKALITPPPEKGGFKRSMRLTVFGDKNEPDAYALWFPLTQGHCYWHSDLIKDEPAEEDFDTIGNDPGKIELNDLTLDHFILYIPVSAKAKAAWTAAQMEKLLPADEEFTDSPEAVDEDSEEPSDADRPAEKP
jgi:hypothetical protein